MKILVISAQKPDSTGSGVYLSQTATAFEAAGHQVAVVCGLDAMDECGLPVSMPLYDVRFRTPDLPFPVCGMSDVMPYEATRYRDLTPEMFGQFYAAFFATIRRACAEFHPDVVLCHHLYLVTAIAVDVVRAALPKSRVFALCHNTCLRQLKSHDLARDFIMDMIPLLDGVLALHEAQRQEIAAMFDIPEARIHVVGTGYDSNVFRMIPAQPGEPAMRSADQVGIVYAGKICFAKGLRELISCLPLTGLDPAKTHVCLAGGHSSAEEHEIIAQLVEESSYHVELIGRVDANRLAKEYNRAHVLVLPSYNEGLPLVIPEALACGCHVVCTDLPGVGPWVSAAMPGAPVRFVDLPRMKAIDQPDPDAVPAFEQRLAAAIRQAVNDALAAQGAGDAPYSCADRVSWFAVASTMLDAFAAC